MPTGCVTSIWFSDLATKNLHFATFSYQLVAKWWLKGFFNFKPCFMSSLVDERLLLTALLFFTIYCDFNQRGHTKLKLSLTTCVFFIVYLNSCRHKMYISLLHLPRIKQNILLWLIKIPLICLLPLQFYLPSDWWLHNWHVIIKSKCSWNFDQIGMPCIKRWFGSRSVESWSIKGTNDPWSLIRVDLFRFHLMYHNPSDIWL